MICYQLGNFCMLLANIFFSRYSLQFFYVLTNILWLLFGSRNCGWNVHDETKSNSKQAKSFGFSLNLIPTPTETWTRFCLSSLSLIQKTSDLIITD